MKSEISNFRDLKGIGKSVEMCFKGPNLAPLVFFLYLCTLAHGLIILTELASDGGHALYSQQLPLPTFLTQNFLFQDENCYQPILVN